MTDQHFLDRVADLLAGLPTVEAVALGGSRAQGVYRPDSDWDLGVYYRGAFEPERLRALARDEGWQGQVVEVGAWGGGVFNGGAWLEIEGRAVDVLYRDLAVVEHEIAEAGAGRVRIEPLMFHLAGIPTYLLMAELAVNRTLRGRLPQPGFPDALRAVSPGAWRDRARLRLDYARRYHAPRGRLTECVGAGAVAALETAHAVLAARGEWVTNEKTLLDRAGLRAVDDLLAGADAHPADLVALCEETGRLLDVATG